MPAGHGQIPAQGGLSVDSEHVLAHIECCTESVQSYQYKTPEQCQSTLSKRLFE